MWNPLEDLKKSKEVLTLNHRNMVYIRPYNTARAKRIADDKLLCKKILSRHGIPTAEVYKVIRDHKQLDSIDWTKWPLSFALKPNIGTGGSGIIVFYGKKKNSLEWIRPDGSTMDVAKIKTHISNILDGQFSMGNRRDIAIVEERIINHETLKPYSYKGIPDIRIIVFNKVPIMAQLRLPTKESDGVANLHAGGICVGIDIASGVTTTAMRLKGASILSDLYQFVENIDGKPELTLSGIQIPQWKRILKISVQCQEASGLGYLGVDIALDRTKGPVVFELNARPGLGIQWANLAGLRSRLERVKGLKIKDVDHGIRVAQNLFGGEVEDEVKAISGRQIVGLIEKATLFALEPEKETTTAVSKKKKKLKKQLPDQKCKVRVNTGVRTSRISIIMAIRLGYKPAIDYFDSLSIPEKFESRSEALAYLEQRKPDITKHELIEDCIVINDDDRIRIRPIIKVTLELADEKFESNMIVSARKDMPYRVIIGRKDLKNFLLDTSKTFVLH